MDRAESSEVDVGPVPSWRVKNVTSSFKMEGTENLSDEVFIKRHLRPEIEERRRKRWDAQKIRDQLQKDKVKQRELNRLSSTARRAREGGELHAEETLWPDPDKIEYIEVTDRVPLAAFGVPIMDFVPREFSLSDSPELVLNHQQSSSCSTKKDIEKKKGGNKSQQPALQNG